MTSHRHTFSDKPLREGPVPESAAMNLISYLLAGLLVFGVPGWLLDRWLGTNWIVGVGIVLGMALAMLTIWARYGTEVREERPTVSTDPTEADDPDDPADPVTAALVRPTAHTDRIQEEQL